MSLAGVRCRRIERRAPRVSELLSSDGWSKYEHGEVEVGWPTMARYMRRGHGRRRA